MRTIIAYIILFLLPILPCKGQSLDVHHIDVGQGDATFIVVKDALGNITGTSLIDGGLKRYGQPIIDYIKDTLHINRINSVIATHYDQDHVGGLAVLLDYAYNNPGQLKVDSVFDRGDVLYPHPNKGKDYKTQAKKFGGARKTLVPGKKIYLYTDTSSPGTYTISMFCICVNGSVYVSDTVNFPVVTSTRNADENDLSTGFVVTYAKFKYLTCGDIGGKRGSQAGTCDGSYDCKFEDLETNVVGYSGAVSAYKLNHHGSRCSSNLNWISRTGSPVAIISSGKNGHYKHPRKEVVVELDAATNIQKYYLTANINYYNRPLGTKGILNANPGQPVELTVNRTNYGVSIADSSIFTVQGQKFKKD